MVARLDVTKKLLHHFFLSSASNDEKMNFVFFFKLLLFFLIRLYAFIVFYNARVLGMISRVAKTLRKAGFV